MEAAVLLSEMPFDSIDKIMNIAMELLEVTGELLAIDIANMTVGLNSLMGGMRHDKSFALTGIRCSSREDYHLALDRNGFLIE
jgi:hypothetical protein